jgi:iron(III) transport system ATP-binding protein
MAAEPVLKVEAIGFAHGARRVLSEVTLSVAAGERVAILGPSGSGKSSLLRLIAGLERPLEGRILLNDQVISEPRGIVPPERRSVGLVFQDDALFPHLTVLDNVVFGLRGQSRPERRTRALDALGRLGLADRARDWPHRLSGGEQQRVAVARALGPRPSVMLMDEPFSRLDSDLRRSVRDDVMTVLREAGVAVVLVTHDAEEALSCADSMVLMADGRVLQAGRPEECYHRPSSIQAARLLGPINAVPATIGNGVATSVLGRHPAVGLPDGPGQVLVRPEDLVLDAAEGVEVARLDAKFNGPTITLHVDAGGTRLDVSCPAKQAPTGSTLRIATAQGLAPTVLPGR